MGFYSHLSFPGILSSFRRASGSGAGTLHQLWTDVFPEKRVVPLTESDLEVCSGHSWLGDTAGPCFMAATGSLYPPGNCPANRELRRELRWMSQVS